MSAVLRGVISKAVPNVKANVMQKATVVSGPPKFKVPMVEKVGLGGVMIFCVIAPASWILMNLQEYKKRPGDE